MDNLRPNSLTPVSIPNWRWNFFLDKAIDSLKRFSLKPFPVEPNFLYREADLGTHKQSLTVRTSTWACQTNRIRKARAACIEASGVASVLNFVVVPFHNFDLPFLGADFVTLPTGHLLALDLQPAVKDDFEHTNEVWKKLCPIHRKWQSLLPSGGSIPEEAKPYFSPGFLWTRLPLGKESDLIIDEIIKPAFIDYLQLFLDLVDKAEEIDSKRSLFIFEGQKNYMNYRRDKDPARKMLNRFYGKEWTESYIKDVLFDLPEKCK